MHLVDVGASALGRVIGAIGVMTIVMMRRLGRRRSVLGRRFGNGGGGEGGDALPGGIVDLALIIIVIKYFSDTMEGVGRRDRRMRERGRERGGGRERRRGLGWDRVGRLNDVRKGAEKKRGGCRDGGVAKDEDAHARIISIITKETNVGGKKTRTIVWIVTSDLLENSAMIFYSRWVLR
jgi:hypothetical protein